MRTSRFARMAHTAVTLPAMSTHARAQARRAFRSAGRTTEQVLVLAGLTLFNGSLLSAAPAPARAAVRPAPVSAQGPRVSGPRRVGSAVFTMNLPAACRDGQGYAAFSWWRCFMYCTVSTEC